MPNSVGDLAVWIAQGRYFLEHGELLRHDIFSVLPTGELIYPAGISILYGLLDRLGGLVAVSLLHKLCVLLFLFILYFSSLRRLAAPWKPRNLAIIGVSLYGSATLCIDRPAEIAILPFMASYLILDKNRPLRMIERFGLIGLTVLWVNIHGSWILLPAMYAWRSCLRPLLHSATLRTLRAEILTGVGILLASLLNPFSYRIYPYTLQTVLISRQRGIDEWAITGFGNYFPQGLLFFALVALVLTVIGWTVHHGRRNHYALYPSLFGSPFFFLLLLGFTAIRNTIWPFLALIPFSFRAGLLGSKESTSTGYPGDPPRVMNGLIVGICVASTILMLPFLKPRIAPWLPLEKRPVFDASAPFEAAAILRSRPDVSPVFNDWNYGSYLAYDQSHPIFIDTRNTIYSDQDFQEYLNVVNADPGWEAVLDHYGIRYILLDRKLRSKLIGEIALRPAIWKSLWENANTVLYERITAPLIHEERE
jgi:hypothetical protein